MTQNLRFISLVIFTALVLSACTINNPPTTTNPNPNPVLPELALELTVSADTTVTFNAINQVITYSYQIKNAGSQSLVGVVSLTDNKAITTCQDVNTVGNADANFDPSEVIPCTGTYSITQADLDAGSVANSATATVGGTTSNVASFPVNMAQNRALTLSKAAAPTTYAQVGDVITYTYVILNGGNVTIQGTFSIADDKAAVNCTQPEDGALSPNEEMSCTATYSILQADLVAGQVTNNASASDGVVTSNNATTTVNNTGASNPNQPNQPSNLTPGTTFQHQVVAGEWLWQIARCYGANPREVVNANPQLSNPSRILPGMIVTVPHIGSVGTIYGSPCIRHIHTVQSGDTWDSIAQLYSADAILLQRANPGGLIPGRLIKVPVGSLAP